MNYLKTNFSDRVNVVETGTARGFSALCMAKALHDSNREGLIVTCDILPHFNKMIWNCIDDHDGPKSRAEILEPWRYLASKYILFHQGYAKIELPKIQFDRVHFAFLDGAHNYDDILSEFEAIKDKQLAGDVIVFDDYNTKQFPGLVKAVDEICIKYTYNRNDINPASDRKYVVATKY
jgi:predicted O-methyltransferase YrrM